MKLVIMPLVVYGPCVASGLKLYTVAAAWSASAVPTAKTCISSREHKPEGTSDRRHRSR